MNNILHNIVLFTANGGKIKVNRNNYKGDGFTICNNDTSYYVMLNYKKIYITKNSFIYLQKRTYYWDQLYKYKFNDFL